MKRNGNIASLEEARRRNPPVDPAEALRRDLRLAFLESVTADDMAKLANKLKSLALGGDLKAMQLLTSLLVAPPSGATQQVVVINESGPEVERPRIVKTIKSEQRDAVPESIHDDAAELIRLEGPLSSETLAARIGCTPFVIESALGEHEWFERCSGGRKWGLSGMGYATLNAEREP